MKDIIDQDNDASSRNDNSTPSKMIGGENKNSIEHENRIINGGVSSSSSSSIPQEYMDPSVMLLVVTQSNDNDDDDNGQ